MKRNNNKLIGWATVLYLVGAFLIMGGLAHLLSDSYTIMYVGGDAYNYIINASQATAYFVLALISVVIASTMVICAKHNTMQNDMIDFYFEHIAPPVEEDEVDSDNTDTELPEESPKSAE